MISNQKFTSGRYRPSNYDGYYSDQVPMRAALANSFNVAAVHMIQQTGVKHVVDLAHRMGIEADVREELSTALGTVDISLLDLTGAYATIGQDGRLITPYGIEKIETKDGIVLYRHEKTAEPRVVSYDHIDALTSMMEDVVKYGTGRRAAPGFPVAGKTGTTQDYRDALFAGFSSKYTMAVWIGNDDNTSMAGGTYGGGIPAAIWRQSMQAAQQGSAAMAVSNYTPSLENRAQSFINSLFSSGNNRTQGSGTQKRIEWNSTRPDGTGSSSFDFND